MKAPIFALLLLLGGCAYLPASSEHEAMARLAALTLADLDAALTIAMMAGDTQAVTCFDSLRGLVRAPVIVPAPVGPISTFALVRINAEASRNARLPPAVKNACAPLVVDAQTLAFRLALIRGGL